jgi:hypothetical protein
MALWGLICCVIISAWYGLFKQAILTFFTYSVWETLEVSLARLWYPPGSLKRQQIDMSLMTKPTSFRTVCTFQNGRTVKVRALEQPLLCGVLLYQEIIPGAMDWENWHTEFETQSARTGRDGKHCFCDITISHRLHPEPKASKRIQTLRISLKQGKFPCSWCYRLKSPSCRIYLTIYVIFRQVSQVGSRFSSLRFCRFGWCMANAPLSERQDARDASLVGASERRERMSCLDFLKHRPPF